MGETEQAGVNCLSARCRDTPRSASAEERNWAGHYSGNWIPLRSAVKAAVGCKSASDTTPRPTCSLYKMERLNDLGAKWRAGSRRWLS